MKNLSGIVRKYLREAIDNGAVRNEVEVMAYRRGFRDGFLAEIDRDEVEDNPFYDMGVRAGSLESLLH